MFPLANGGEGDAEGSGKVCLIQAETSAEFGDVVAYVRGECVARFVDDGEVARGREGAFPFFCHLYPFLGDCVELGVKLFYRGSVAAGAADFGEAADVAGVLCAPVDESCVLGGYGCNGGIHVVIGCKN